MSNPIDDPRHDRGVDSNSVPDRLGVTVLIDLDALAGLEPNVPRQGVGDSSQPEGSELVRTPRRRLVPSLNAICTACGHHQLVTPTDAFPVYDDEVCHRRNSDIPERDEWTCYVFRNCNRCGSAGARFVLVSRQAAVDYAHRWAIYDDRIRDHDIERRRAAWIRAKDRLKSTGAIVSVARDGADNDPGVWIGWWLEDDRVEVKLYGRARYEVERPRRIEIETSLLRAAYRWSKNRRHERWYPTGKTTPTQNDMYVFLPAVTS